MIDAAEQARQLAVGVSATDLERDRQRRDALLWNFTVLGEAAARLSGDTQGGPATVAVRTQHLARPGRRAIVVTDLAGLRGPDHGTVELPLRLFWSSQDRHFDLDSPSTRRCIYQTILREAARSSDLTHHLNRGMLISLWPGLRLPAGVRRAWEELHPVLRSSGNASWH
jgi:hypothetical protein